MRHELQYVPDDELFSASDLSLSAALLTFGYKLTGIDRQNPSKAEFLFKYKSGISDIADKFWARLLKQDSRTYFENLKLLKNMLYSNAYDPNR